MLSHYGVMCQSPMQAILEEQCCTSVAAVHCVARSIHEFSHMFCHSDLLRPTFWIVQNGIQAFRHVTCSRTAALCLVQFSASKQTATMRRQRQQSCSTSTSCGLEVAATVTSQSMFEACRQWNQEVGRTGSAGSACVQQQCALCFCTLNRMSVLMIGIQQ